VSSKKPKSWREKLAADDGLPKVKPITGSMCQKWGSGTFVIPAPREVNEIMRTIPRGRVITGEQIREQLAARHGASICCPLTTGIFIWIAANAAEEDAAEGRKYITPYWRTLKAGGVLNEKFPGGAERQKLKLEAEGHRIIAKGKKLRVAEFERALVKPVTA